MQPTQVGKSNEVSSILVWLLSFPVILPVIGFLAAYYISRVALLVFYFIVAISVFAARLRLPRNFTDPFYLVLTWAVSLSLLLSQTVISPYITASDISTEFVLFQQVAQTGVWHPQINILYNAALSVTILPTIVSLVTSLEGTLVFKIVYPLLFSLVPMVLYPMYRKIMSPQAAFISIFVVLSYPATYVDLPALARQMIAELILVVLVSIQLSPALRKIRASSLLVLLLTLGLVVSHYSVALIYAILISFSFIVSRIPRLRFESLSGPLIPIVTSIMWFLFVASAIVLQNLSVSLAYVMLSMSNFLNPTSRPPIIMAALGVGPVETGILHLINRGTQYLVSFLLILGFAIFIRKRKTRVENVFAPLMGAALFFLFASIILPNVAGALNLDRIYQIVLLLVAPCFYFGAVRISDGLQWLCNFVARRPMRIRLGSVPAVILFSYLLFTSGWVWAVTGDAPTSPVLDYAREANPSSPAHYDTWYIASEDVAAARWLRSYGVMGQLVCADENSLDHVLLVYGGYAEGYFLSYGCSLNGNYLYLSLGNVLWNTGFNGVYPLNPSIFSLENRIYSDGGAIYDGA